MRILTVILIMGIFGSIFGCKNNVSDDGGTFRTVAEYDQNRANQIAMTPQTISQLRNYEVTDQTELKLEYFFYTDSETKAKNLNQELSELGYVGGFGVSANSEDEYVITGWTVVMKMDENVVLDWTTRMCDIGRKHDCEFDGWGTNPNQ